jgi:hypothetical protein
VISFTSCSGKSSDLVGINNGNRAVNSASSDEKLYYLDLNSPSIVQAIDATTENLENAKFVRVEVVDVVNPGKLPIAFQVHYQTRTGEKLYLGSFGLYPSDNPGKFLIATRGKLRKEGAVVLSLVRPENVVVGDTIRVGVKRMQFVNE